MTNNTPISDEEYQKASATKALYESQKAYEASLARHALYLAIKPLVDSDEFISIHQQITALRDTGPKDDMFFGIGLDAIYNGMTNLGIQVANWTAPVDPNASTPTPPAPEGNTNGE